MLIYQGMIKGKVVVLPEEVHLEEGTIVEVRFLLSPQAQSSQPTESMFKQRLITLNLLTEAKTPPPISLKARRFIQVKGKPLSQTIIEERR